MIAFIAYRSRYAHLLALRDAGSIHEHSGQRIEAEVFPLLSGGVERSAKPRIRLPAIPIEVLLLAVSIWFALTANSSLWRTLAEYGGDTLSERVWVVASVTTIVVSSHWVCLLFVVPRCLARVLLPLLMVATAAAAYLMDAYGVYLDKGMLRNVFETNVSEVGELVSNHRFLWHVLIFGIAPSVLVVLVPLKRYRVGRALLRRAVFILIATIMTIGALWQAARVLVPIVREKKEIRYLVTPANYLVAASRVLADRNHRDISSRTIAAPDAFRDPPRASYKPKAFIVIVGETVRAENWSLNGYRRQTTPQLLRRQVVNFGNVQSCGSSTAVSLPCMFSFYGRKNYDEEKIRSSESVLHVLQRVGVATLWRDNQGGCKGVCDALPFESISQTVAECRTGQCFDERLLDGLAEKIQKSSGDTLIVLHMMGNHGPAYSLRYPIRFTRWAPVCTDVNLARCSNSSLINAYDNGIVYTDHVISMAIDLLQTINSHETGLLFVSDHGESLGERNVYLHGMPYVLAPDSQKQVPMVMWLSQPMERALGVDASCLRRTAKAPRSHDDIPSTLLSIFQVKTAAYEPNFDLLSGCR